ECWTNVLIGRRGGMRDDSLADRDGLTDYLRRSLAACEGYDKIVYQLLTAEGANRTGAPQYNGAINFLLTSYDDKRTLATNRPTRLLLGRQLQCAQCNTHHVTPGPQQQYWQIHPSFRQLHAERVSGASAEPFVRLVPRAVQG